MSTVFSALVSSLVPRTLLSSSSSLYDYHSVFTSPPPLKMLSHGRYRSSSSSFLSSSTVISSHYYSVTVAVLIFLAVLLQASVMANPVPAATTELSPTTSSPDGTVRKMCDGTSGEQQSSSGTESSLPPCSTLEDTFRSNLMKDSKNQVYIDTLTPEEAAEHAKTGRLPKRTMELIEKVLMDQKQKDENASKSGSAESSSSGEAADLYDELFNRSRKRT